MPFADTFSLLGLMAEIFTTNIYITGICRMTRPRHARQLSRIFRTIHNSYKHTAPSPPRPALRAQLPLATLATTNSRTFASHSNFKNQTSKPSESIMPPNPFLLAADNPAALLPLLRETPALASQQDDHGYSLLHAAASYNHLDLLRALVREFHVPVDLRDEDDETALFVVETVDAARVLVEELGLDVSIRGEEGTTAREKIEVDGDFPDVAGYLRTKEGMAGVNGAGDAQEANGGGQVNGQINGQVNGGTNGEINGNENGVLPPVPQGLSVNFGTIPEGEVAGASPNPEFRRRIEELAAREDFHTDAGQAALRRLVEEAIAGEDLAEERNVRPREG